MHHAPPPRARDLQTYTKDDVASILESLPIHIDGEEINIIGVDEGKRNTVTYVSERNMQHAKTIQGNNKAQKAEKSKLFGRAISAASIRSAAGVSRREWNRMMELNIFRQDADPKYKNAYAQAFCAAEVSLRNQADNLRNATDYAGVLTAVVTRGNVWEVQYSWYGRDVFARVRVGGTRPQNACAPRCSCPLLGLTTMAWSQG